MAEKPTVTVKVTRRFDSSPEAVFDAWLDPSAVGEWLFHTPDGAMKKIEIDARVGGRFEISEQRGDDFDRHVGEYLVIERPRKLVFTFAYIGPKKPDAEETRVTVEIDPAEKGCLLTLTHEGVLVDWGEETRGGWTMILDGLATTLVG
ncbi:MAG: SRPBCC domain-containing protein [Parvularculaceae bacterium]